MYLKKITGLLCLVFLLGFGQNLFAQSITIRGKVIDAKNGNPLTFANIIVNGGTYGTTTDLEGYFSLSLPENQIKRITFSYIGYQTFDYLVNTPEDLKPLQYELNIKLIESTSPLSEILVESGENPAHRIIRLATKNRKKNDPEKIASFQYKAYNKFLVNLEDKKNKIDTVEIITQTVDSSELNLQNHLKNHHLFIAESITERKYIAPGHNKETVLANRIAGFKDPGFMALVADFKPFSFYQDFISILDVNYLSPISPGSTDKYFFNIEDTTFFDQDTVFVISFSPLEDKNFDGLEGLMYINTNQYALQNVIAQTLNSKSLIDFKIEQHYDRLDGYYWFPTQLQADIIFNDLKVSERKLRGFSRTFLKDIQIHPDIYRKDFDEVTLEVDPKAASRAPEYWDRYRVKALEPKDIQTYSYLDSLGKQFKFDRMIRISEAFTTTRLPLGNIDLDLANILKANRFEGARLGAAFFTNHKWSKDYTLGVYAAYGTKDGRFKYGLSGEVNLFNRFDVRAGLQYQDDVREPANVYFIENRPLFSNGLFRYFLTERMDRYRSGEIYLSWRPLRNLQMRVGLNSDEVEPLYEYLFQQQLNDDTETVNRFRFTEISVKLYYAHNQEYMRANQRRLFIKNTFPVVNFNYTRGGEFLGGEYDYHKFEAQIQHNILWRRFGQTNVQLHGGYVQENVPYPVLYQGRGLTRQVPILVDNYFQTMELYEFLADRYVYLFFTHHFGQLLWKTNSNIFKPEFSIAHNMGWGDLQNPDSHTGIEVNTLDKVYYESGFYINNLLRVKYFNIAYLGLGAGVFFRYGPYAKDKFLDNSFFKITTTFSFQ